MTQSIAFNAGVAASKRGEKLKDAVHCLMVGSPRYFDFIDGFDSVKAVSQNKTQLKRARYHDERYD